jgi:class 3 adenylate cyclase
MPALLRTPLAFGGRLLPDALKLGDNQNDIPAATRRTGLPSPPTRYAISHGAYIAYQVLGEGPLNLIYLGGMVTHVDLMWDLPEAERFLTQLSRFSRVILFDHRGTGASDPIPLEALPPAEEWSRDLIAVMDAAGSRRAAIVAERDAGTMALQFAGQYPERVSALILANATARHLRADDYPEGSPTESLDLLYATLLKHWGTEAMVGIAMPSRKGDAHFATVAARFQRAAATPRGAAEQFRHFLQMDARSSLPKIDCPVLILHRDKFPFMDAPAHARYLERHIRNARRVEIEGADVFLSFDRAEQTLGLIEEFLTGRRAETYSDRVPVTVMFVDLVGSTELASERGDAAWRDLLTRFHALVRMQLQRFRGREVDNAGDGFFAVFDTPGRALRCAAAIRDESVALGVKLRAGLHAGECEIAGLAVRGLAVHIGARVMGEAEPDEVLVSSTVRELLAGSDFEFSRRGEHRLKGIDGRWRLYALAVPKQ